jgi:hypothetical protein
MIKIVNRILKKTDYRVIRKTEMVVATKSAIKEVEKYAGTNTSWHWIYKHILDLGRTSTGERK